MASVIWLLPPYRISAQIRALIAQHELHAVAPWEADSVETKSMIFAAHLGDSWPSGNTACDELLKFT